MMKQYHHRINYIVTVYQILTGGIRIFAYGMFETEPTKEAHLKITDQMKAKELINKKQWEVGDVISSVVGRREEPEQFEENMMWVERNDTHVFYPSYYHMN